ncbi:MAG TPA: DUF2298 domain-containing protein [Anaerolineae bacterium]
MAAPALGGLAEPSVEAGAGAREATRGRSNPRAAVALAGLLLIAAALRLHGLNWDQSQHVHPDERFVVWVADTVHWPGSLAAALDPATSPLNPFRWPAGQGDLSRQPRNYAYGHLPLYLLVAVAELGEDAAKALARAGVAVPPAWLHLAAYGSLAWVGRAISALCDLGTLLLAFGLARRLYGRASAGLLAAAAYALAVMPIQLSHYYAVDMVLTLCVVATVAAAVAAAESGAWWTWPLAGGLAGLAVGSKFSAVLLAAPLAAAAFYHLPRPGREAATVRLVFRRLALTFLSGIAVFILTNPFAVIEGQAYLRNLFAQNAMVNGKMDAPYTRQFIGTAPYWYYVRQLSQWGLGWPLGLAAWAGLAWAVWRALRGRASPGQTVALAWAVPYFAITGTFYAKFPRYLAPLLPFLLVFAAGGGLALYGWLADRWQRRGRLIALGGAAAILLFTAGWALAFSSIYDQVHPWIQASNWIYRNIPAGSKLLGEQWDDALPLAMDEIPGRPAKRTYRQVLLPLYDPDTRAKLDTLVSELSSSDYVVLASNRLWRPIGRLPERYPLTSVYYKLLFDGELGYTPVADFATYPRRFGIAIPDENADESFTVYDHPHPRIFANTGRLSVERMRNRLARDLPLQLGATRTSDQSASAPSHPIQLKSAPDTPNPSKRIDARSTVGKAPGLAAERPLVGADVSPADKGAGVQAQSTPPGLLPAASRAITPMAGVSDFRWNRIASGSVPATIFLWWLALSLFGWLVWPLLFPLFGGLRDRGYGLARLAGWLLVGWVHWLGVSLDLWQNRTVAIAVVLALLAAAGTAAAVRQRQALRIFWARRGRLLLAEEALFAVAFLVFAGIRLLNPDLWQPWNGGEKFMEFAFLNAILRSPHFPPYDPYFAGGTINYYYYGLYLVSLPIKLTGIFAEVAFNVAVPGLFAQAALAAFSVAASLARRPRAAVRLGLLTVVLALLLANQTGFSQLLARLAELGGAAPGAAFNLGLALRGLGLLVRGAAAWPGYDYWAVSRVIPYTINEFPFWSFLFADLHPHLIAIPTGLAVVGLALNDLLLGDRRQAWPAVLGRTGLLVIALGALGPTNTWDLPVYFLLVVGVFLLAAWRRGHPAALLAGLGRALLVGVLAVLAYLPFYLHYQALIGDQGERGLGRYLGFVHAGDPLRPWIDIWGFFLFVAASFVLYELFAHGRVGPRRVIALLVVTGLGLVCAMAGRPAVGLAVVPLGLALALAWRRAAAPRTGFVLLLLGLGLGILAGTQLVYLRDFLDGGDWYRMNTVFKFGIPAWLSLAVAGAAILAWLWPASGTDGVWSGKAPLWQAAAVSLLLAGLVFLPFGIQARVDDRFPGPRPPLGTFDGMAYMTTGTYTWPDDRNTITLAPDDRAIHWLLDHVDGAPVVAEAPAGNYMVNGAAVAFDYYRAGGLRVASLTGLPTFLGQHQIEQRDAAQVAQREVAGQEFFTTTDLARTRVLLRDLAVSDIYIGQLERYLFPAPGLAKFDILAQSHELAVVYRDPQVTIYRIAGQ